MARPRELPAPTPRNDPTYSLRELLRVTEEKQLTLRHLLMIQEIANLSTARGYCFAGQRHLAHRLTLGRRQTQTIVQQLVDAGYVEEMIRKGKPSVLRVRQSPFEMRSLAPAPVDKLAQTGVGVAQSTAQGWRGALRYPVAQSSAPHGRVRVNKEGDPTLFTPDGPRRFEPWRPLYGSDARTIEARLAWAVNSAVVTHLRIGGDGEPRRVAAAKHSNGTVLLQLADPDEQLTIRAQEISRHWFGQWVDGGEEKTSSK